MRLKQHSMEVLLADETIVRLGQTEMAALQAALAQSSRGRSRICAHRDNSDSLHEMLIALSRATYIRPHKHFGKSESFHIVQGELDVVIFDEQGGIGDVVRMGPYGSGRDFFYRLADPLFHTVMVRSETVVFHETTNGPFKREDTQFAPWSPAETELGAVAVYVRRLADMVETFIGATAHQR